MHKINNKKAQLTLVKSISISVFKAPKKRKYVWLSSDLSDVIKIFYSGLKCLFFGFVLWVHIARMSSDGSTYEPHSLTMSFPE